MVIHRLRLASSFRPARSATPGRSFAEGPFGKSESRGGGSGSDSGIKATATDANEAAGFAKAAKVATEADTAEEAGPAEATVATETA